MMKTEQTIAAIKDKTQNIQTFSLNKPSEIKIKEYWLSNSNPKQWRTKISFFPSQKPQTQEEIESSRGWDNCFAIWSLKAREKGFSCSLKVFTCII